MTVLLIIGILLAIGGGGGYVYANKNLNDGDFWWDNYGTKTYTDMVQMRDIAMYALIAGGVLVFAALVFMAIKKANQGKALNVTAAVAAAPAAPAAPAPAASVCPGCGAPLKPGARFCGRCGRDLSQPKVRRCAACGRELGENDVFCPQCGKKFGA